MRKFVLRGLISLLAMFTVLGHFNGGFFRPEKALGAAPIPGTGSWTKMGGASLGTPSYVNTLLPVDGLLYAGSEDGLWTYRDSDDAWTKMDGLTGDVYTLLPVDGTLYALVPDGVWTYKDGAWTQMSGSQSHAVDLLPVDGTLYAGTSDGVWMYKDGAWTRMSGSPSHVYDLLSVDGTLYVGTADGVWTYRDGAWTQTSGMLSGVSNLILLPVDGTLHALVQEFGDADWSSSIWTYSAISNVDGTWTKMEGGDSPSHAYALLKIGDTLYAGASDGIWAYRGDAWTRIEGSPSATVSLIHVGDVPYALASDGIWTYSDVDSDGDFEWTLMEGSPSEAYALFSDDDTLYAVTEDGVYRYGSGDPEPDIVTAISGEPIEVTTEPVSITVPQGVTDVKIQSTTTANGPNEQVATVPLIQVNATTSLGNVSVSIPAGTTITGPAGWDGTISLPQVLSNSSVAVSNGTVNAAIEVGAGDSKLTFNKAVRLVLPGQAGKSIGFARNGVVTEITRTLDTDDQATADAQIPAEGDAKIIAGNDIVIWTKHFTTFLSYTPISAGENTADLMQWQFVGGEGFSEGKAEYPWMAVDSSGAPYVVYIDGEHDKRATVMKYDGSNWVTVGSAGFSNPVYYYISIAIDSNDVPYVLYADTANSKGATVMKYDKDGQGQYRWMNVGAANFSGGSLAVDYPAIAIDSSGTPYVVYGSFVNGYKTYVKRFDGTNWVPVGGMVSTGRAPYASIAFDSSGSVDIPYVAYNDGKNSNKGAVKKYDVISDSWVSVGNVPSTDYVQFTSIAIDNSGTPYVAFQDGANSEKATVKKLAGSSWETVGSGEVSEGAAFYTSIALDSSGTPYVAYQDNGTYDRATHTYSGGTYKAIVKKLAGSSWETVGSEDISEGEMDSPWLAIDVNDTPYVVYQDMATTKASVKKYTPISKYTVSASAATDIPEVGADNAITLTVKNSLGNTDKSFSGALDVTVSGYEQAPNNSYGSFNGTALTAGPNTIGVTFANGVATANLRLNKAAAQTIQFSAAGVATPATNALSITPIAGAAASMALTTDIAAPASNGGVFAQQPGVTLLDAYGNKSTGDNSTVVTVSRKDTGAWTLTGTVTATASAGIVTFAGLGATNAAGVTGAQLAFDATGGLAQIASRSVTLPWPGTVAPNVESVAVGDGRVVLTWHAVYGSVSYAVYQRTASDAYGAAIATVTGLTYDVAGLTNGTTYFFMVKATNPGGDSASNEVSATPRTVPSAPKDVTAAAGNGRAIVSFTAPANGGSVITSYEVTVMPGNMTVTGTGSPITITGLTNGVTYSFTVKAVNSAGSGTASNASNPVTPRAPSDSGGTSTPPAATSDPAPPATPEPTTDPEKPKANVFNSGIIHEANLLKRFESKVAAAKKANVKSDFPDIQGHWAKDTIDIFAVLRLISGYEDGSFKPNGHITRAEFAAILSRVFDITGGDHTSAVLKDVDSHWAKRELEQLAKAGVINGYGDGTFRPDNTITREEMVVMLSRIVNLDNVTKEASKGNFNDLKGTFAADEIEAAAQAEIIRGIGGGKFAPHSNATRAEALQIILNALKLNPQLKTLLDSLN